MLSILPLSCFLLPTISKFLLFSGLSFHFFPYSFFQLYFGIIIGFQKSCTERSIGLPASFPPCWHVTYTWYTWQNEMLTLSQHYQLTTGFFFFPDFTSFYTNVLFLFQDLTHIPLYVGHFHVNKLASIYFTSIFV